MQMLLNIGGPDRVSRVQMAETVAHVRGYNASLIKPVSASLVCILIFYPNYMIFVGSLFTLVFGWVLFECVTH